MTAFGAPREEIPRGDWGKPLILPVDGSGELVEYDRASSWGKAIDDGAGLTYWAKCMVIKGASKNPALVRSAAPLDYDTDKRKLFELAEAAMTLAGAGNKASEGTAMHAWTDIVDRGDELPDDLDPSVRRDLDAYRKVTSGLEVVEAERFVVIDELRVAGSFDRVLRVPNAAPWPTWLQGRTCIGDLKTGNADGAIASIAIQLALYSRGKLYEANGTRTPLDVDQNVGLVVHLPLGKGTARILAVDLDTGWQGALAAAEARRYQKAAKLGCKSCHNSTGFYKSGSPCRFCKGVARVPIGVPVVEAAA